MKEGSARYILSRYEIFSKKEVAIFLVLCQDKALNEM